MVAIWALIPSTFKWLGLVVLIGALGVGAWKWEHNAKLKAEAVAAISKNAAAISQEQVLLYQNRAATTAKGAKKRGQIDDWQRKGDLDSLIDDFNTPDGVSNLPANPPGSPKRPPGKYRAQGTGETYQEAP